MLVLSRKVGERILIGDQVEITVVRLTPGGVRIGVSAPNEMSVVRGELLEALKGNALNGGSLEIEFEAPLAMKPR